MRNQRSLRAKAIDAPADEPVDSLAANICRELASKEVDYEVAFVGGKRFVQCAYPEKAPVKQHADIRPGSTWVVTGGARGITAECALALGRRFGLKLHLLGTSPLRQIDPVWRNLSPEGLKSLKGQRDARSPRRRTADGRRVGRVLTRPGNRSLAAGLCRRGRECNVSRLRRGRPRGVGRRAGDDSPHVRADRGHRARCRHRAGGRPTKRNRATCVAATLGAKVDGALNLLRLTASDPLRLVHRLRLDQRPAGKQRPDRLLPGQRHAVQTGRLVSRSSGPGVHASGFIGTPGATWAWPRVPSRPPRCESPTGPV